MFTLLIIGVSECDYSFFTAVSLPLASAKSFHVVFSLTANKLWVVKVCEPCSYDIIRPLVSSPAAGPEPAPARGGGDDASAGRGAGGGHQLAAVTGGCAPTLGNHLPQSPLPHQSGHGREAPLRPHIR